MWFDYLHLLLHIYPDGALSFWVLKMVLFSSNLDFSFYDISSTGCPRAECFFFNLALRERTIQVRLHLKVVLKS